MDTISQLMIEIREMENIRLYYENRILKKQIAIAEILNSLECRQDQTDTAVENPPVKSKRHLSEETRRKMSDAHKRRRAIRSKCLKDQRIMHNEGETI
jgi:hypothetical protein